jgi:hypothetical protein
MRPGNAGSEELAPSVMNSSAQIGQQAENRQARGRHHRAQPDKDEHQPGSIERPHQPGQLAQR